MDSVATIPAHHANQGQRKKATTIWAHRENLTVTLDPAITRAPGDGD